jgi:dTDP-4-amino-4,6-dideoxygalactose transaminase
MGYMDNIMVMTCESREINREAFSLKVGMADLVKQYRSIQDEINEAIADVLHTGRFILGPVVQSLEEEIASFCGAKFGVGVNSGTDALLLSLLSLGIQPGDEVITTPFTFVATAEVVALVGGVPVFADIDPQTFNLDASQVEQKITSKTRAIIPVDLFGQMADRDALCNLAEKHGLALVWDAAQAIGAAYKGKPLGAFPGLATLSFFPTKNLGAYGDGGMVLTNDEGIRDNLLKRRFHGSGGGYYYDGLGYCSRLDAMQAAILRVKLKYLPQWNALRVQHAARYHDLLKGVSVTLPYEDPKASHVYHQFTIRTVHRDALQSHLKSHGIDSGIYYPLALHLQKAYKKLGCKEGDFPNAEAATKEVLSIPIYPELEEEQILYVVKAVKEFEENN